MLTIHRTTILVAFVLATSLAALGATDVPEPFARLAGAVVRIDTQVLTWSAYFGQWMVHASPIDFYDLDGHSILTLDGWTDEGPERWTRRIVDERGRALVEEEYSDGELTARSVTRYDNGIGLRDDYADYGGEAPESRYRLAYDESGRLIEVTGYDGDSGRGRGTLGIRYNANGEVIDVYSSTPDGGQGSASSYVYGSDGMDCVMTRIDDFVSQRFVRKTAMKIVTRDEVGNWTQLEIYEQVETSAGLEWEPYEVRTRTIYYAP